MNQYIKPILGAVAALALYSCGSKPAQQTPTTQVPTQDEKPTGELAELLEEIDIQDLGNDIQVFTTKIGNDPNKHNLTISFPITKESYINEAEAAFSQKFIDEFKQEAQRLGDSATAAIDYNQHFEVVYPQVGAQTFLYTRSISNGNNYDDQLFVRIYDTERKTRLNPIDLFSSPEAFTAFSKEAKKLAQEAVRKCLKSSKSFANEQEREQAWMNLQEQIEDGLQPTNENYDGLYFASNERWYLLLDKYQIASGDLGSFEIEVPEEMIVPYLDKRLSTALLLAAAPIIEGETHSAMIEETLSPEEGKAPRVALTFDDGPSVYTEKLLDILLKEEVKATFFVIGKSAAVQSKTIQRMGAEGHIIGNHSYDHKNFAKISLEEAQHQIELTDRIIEQALNQKPPYFRFPYGAYTQDKLALIKRPVIGWNVDPLDWKYKDAERVAAEMCKAKDGAIILGHDIHKTTVEAIPQVIRTLKSKGYRFVSLDELFKGKNIKPNKVYTSGK